MGTNIKFDARNYRKHNDRNKVLINKSLKECGAGRSIVIDNENNIIAGNGVYSQAQLLGIPTKIIETNGSELIVVKRTDLKTDDAKRKQLAVMDNSTSDSSDFDLDLLQEDFDMEQLDDFGIQGIEYLDGTEIDEIEEITTSYNIIIKCENFDIAENINQKYKLDLDLDSQKLVVDAKRFL